MLAEIRRNQRQGRPVFRGTIYFDWKSERYRRRPRISRHNFDSRSRRQLRPVHSFLVRYPVWKFFKVRLDAFGKTLRKAAGKTYDQISAGVMVAIEIAHILDRQLFKRTDLTDVVVPVRMPCINNVVEMFLSKFFIVALSKRNSQKIDCFLAQTFEILGTKSRIEEQVFQQGIVAIEIFDVSRSAEHGHLFINLCTDG